MREAIHASRPDRFQIPGRRIREVLRPGDPAKLIFAIQFDRPEGKTAPQLEFERMWVRVMKRAGGRHPGRLANGRIPSRRPGTNTSSMAARFRSARNM